MAESEKPEAAVEGSLLGTRWDFSDRALTGWRHKDNGRIAIVGDENPALRLESDFGAYAFTWTTRHFEPRSLDGVVHIVFRVHGDGSGNRLLLHLGAPSSKEKRSLYYINARQAITLDFTGWRKVSVDLAAFETPADGLRKRDFAQVQFLEFMVQAGEAKKPLDIQIDDIEFTPATADELAAEASRRAEREKIVAECGPRLSECRKQLESLAGQLALAEKQGKFVAEVRAYHAALDWCAKDIDRLLAAEELEIVRRAPPCLAAMEDRLKQPQAVLGHVQEKPPQEPDRLDWENNKYFRSVVGGVRPWTTAERTWPKGRPGYAAVPDAWSFRGFGDNLFGIVWSVTRPKSPVRHHPMLLANALNLFDVIAHQHTAGDFNIDRTAVHGRDANINRFCLAPALDAWRELNLAYPELLPEPWRQDIAAGLRKLVDYQVTDYGTARLAKLADPRHPAYPNMDVHYLLIMDLAQRLWHEPRYAQERDAFFKILQAAVYPDGAFTYIHTQNECFVYHRIDVAYLARHWQLSQNPEVLELLRRTTPYYPYNVEPEGMPEYYTDPCWKHYWGEGDSIGPGIIAALFDDPLNKQVAETCAAVSGYGRGHEAAIAAECWKPIVPKPLPDRYVRFDANIEGPRGRYGRWSFAGNGRNYGVGHQGKDTFVGAMLTQPPQRRQLPLDAALQVVTAEVRLNHTENHWYGGRCVSAQERLTTSLGPDFGTLAVRYLISRPRWNAKDDETLPWQGTQTWYLSKTRLIGLVSIEALADQRQAGVHGRIRLGLNRKLEQLDGQWKYGGLRIVLHGHNYAKVEARASETTFQDEPSAYHSTEITLIDPLSEAAGDKGGTSFPKGTCYWFLVEVRPEGSPAAEAVERIEQSGAVGFRFREPGRCVAVLHNPTDRPIEVKLTDLPKTATLYEDNSGKGRALAVETQSLPLAPHRHVARLSEPCR